jgi:3',5'-cyclic AMP phosphodiesterase CpdA
LNSKFQVPSSKLGASFELGIWNLELGTFVIMRTLIHLSDIHFGRVDHAMVERLKEKIEEIRPSLVVVSGDLTQRARSRQFMEAREFLEKLPKPQIVVPGNHDVPLYNVFNRFARPLDKYCRYLTKDLEPFYADEEIAVMGINTARSLTIKGGRVNKQQIARIRERFCVLSNEIVKILVTHHPFDVPEEFDDDATLGRANMAMQSLAGCGADVFLSGHLHVSRVIQTAERYKLRSGRSALVIQAGTATSTRGRGEANSFNVLEFEPPRLTIKRLECKSAETGFAEAEILRFNQTEKGWSAAPLG